MLFALIHELGHLVAGLLMGMKPEKIDIMPFGVSISFKIDLKEYNKKIKMGNKFEIKKIIVAAFRTNYKLYNYTNYIFFTFRCNKKFNNNIY